MRPLEPHLDVPEIETFAEWKLSPALLEALTGMGIVKPTPIQCLAIDPVLKGRDVIAKAETGTGKTLAFGLPILEKLDAGRSTVLALILAPTRELAEQVADVMTKLGEVVGLQVALIVGGEKLQPQVKALQAGAQIVVGTPGRVLDLINQKFLHLPWTEFAVLDEADKMLEIGFLEDIEKIFSHLPLERQTLLFSATFPPALLTLARNNTQDPMEVATAIGVATVDNIHQSFLEVNEEDRARILVRLFDNSGPEDVFLVFCDRRSDVDLLMRKLERSRHSIKALHGGYDQAARFRVMGSFRTGEVKALVATDVASRGLDVEHVTHVINFDVPRDASDYTHRIGRTGRAGRDGKALTFVTAKGGIRWKSLLSQVTWEIEPFGQRRSKPPAEAEPERETPREERPRRSSRERQPERDTRPEREPRDQEPSRREPEREDRQPREEPPAPRSSGKRPKTGRRETTRERLARERGESEQGSEVREPQADRKPAREDREDRPRRQRPEPKPRAEERERQSSERQSSERQPSERQPRESRPKSRSDRSPEPGSGGFGSGV